MDGSDRGHIRLRCLRRPWREGQKQAVLLPVVAVLEGTLEEGDKAQPAMV